MADYENSDKIEPNEGKPIPFDYLDVPRYLEREDRESQQKYLSQRLATENPEALEKMVDFHFKRGLDGRLTLTHDGEAIIWLYKDPNPNP